MGSQFARFARGATHQRSRVEARSEFGRSPRCNRPGTRNPTTLRRCRAEFEKAIELDPTSFDAYYFYARSSFEAGDLEKAVQLFEKAHRSRPEDYQATALRALALHELGWADEARATDQQAMDLINKYLEINPNEARAYSLGASPLARLGKPEDSKRWSEQAIALAPNDPVILYNAACNLAQLGEPDAALDRLERSIEAGVAVADWIKHDPDFENLRDHPASRRS
jgi:adenylate cyclase